MSSLTQRTFDRAQRSHDAQYEAPRGRPTRGRPSGEPLTVKQARKLWRQYGKLQENGVDRPKL